MRSLSLLGKGLIILLTTLALLSVAVANNNQTLLLEEKEVKSIESSFEIDDDETVSHSLEKPRHHNSLELSSFLYQSLFNYFYILKALQPRAPPLLEIR